MRFVEGQALANGGHRTAAISLWGYAAEMTLKATYFREFGFGDDRPIALVDLRAARVVAQEKYGLNWQMSNLHDLSNWGQLLNAQRNVLGTVALPADPELLRQCDRLHARWRETLRYRTNVAYHHEVEAVREGVRWLLEHTR